MELLYPTVLQIYYPTNKNVRKTPVHDIWLSLFLEHFYSSFPGLETLGETLSSSISYSASTSHCWIRSSINLLLQHPSIFLEFSMYRQTRRKPFFGQLSLVFWTTWGEHWVIYHSLLTVIRPSKWLWPYDHSQKEAILFFTLRTI